MTEDDIRKKVVRILRKIAPDTEPDKLNPEDNIRQVLGIDSFDYLSFIVALDEELGVQTPEEDYGKIGSLSLLVPYILKRAKTSKS
jgi:acyl carrier protein